MIEGAKCGAAGGKMLVGTRVSAGAALCNHTNTETLSGAGWMMEAAGSVCFSVYARQQDRTRCFKNGDEVLRVHRGLRRKPRSRTHGVCAGWNGVGLCETHKRFLAGGPLQRVFG